MVTKIALDGSGIDFFPMKNCKEILQDDAIARSDSYFRDAIQKNIAMCVDSSTFEI